MKKIIFLVLLFFTFSYSDDVGECCTQYGLFDSGDSSVSDNTHIVGSGHWTNTESDTFISDHHSEYNGVRVCVEAGLVDTRSLRDEITGTDYDDDYKIDRFVYDLFLIYHCACNLDTHPNTDKTEKPNMDLVYDGIASEAPAECYEPVAPYEAYDYSENCIVKKVCYTAKKDCSSKGSDWTYNSSSTSDTCFDWVDGDNFDSADFTDGVCCLHDAPDNNDTNPTPTPSPTQTPTPTPAPTLNPNCDANQRNDTTCTAPYHWDESICGCAIPPTPTPAPTPNNNDGGNGGNNDGGTNNGGNGGGSSTTDDILNDIKADSQSNHEETQQKMEETNNILRSINSNINVASSVNHSDLNNVKNSVDNASSKNHSDLNNVKSSIDDVKNSVDSASSKNHSDLGKIDNTLSGIKEGTDALKNLIDDGEAKKGDLTDATNQIKNSVEDAKNNYSNVLDIFSGLASSYTDTPPVFTGSGDSTFSATVYGSSVVFDFAMVANLRQYFDIVFVLLLAYLNFRIYLWIFRFLVKLGG